MTLSVLAAIGIYTIAVKVEEKTEKKTKKRIGLALRRIKDGTATQKDIALINEIMEMAK